MQRPTPRITSMKTASEGTIAHFNQLIDMAKRGQAEFPKEGIFQLKQFKKFVPARIYRPVPVDPDTGEVLDRWPQLQGEINGREADYREVWVYGREITKGEYKWLIAKQAIQSS
jgi:hypothetical protein